MNMKAVIGIVKETFADWSEDKAARLAASLAYFTMFSIAPLLVIIIAIAGLVWGREAARGAIVGQIQGMVGQQGAQMIQTMVQNTSKQSTSIIATIIGVVTLLLGASGAFGALQDALNTIWGVTANPKSGLMGMLRDRFVSFSMILVVGFLLLVSLALSAGLSALGKFVGGLFPGAQALAQIMDFVISFVVITLLFALIYKVLPDVKIAWSDVWIGAVATALLFTIGKFAIGLYLGRGSVGSAYGAAGSLVVVLVWIYYSAMILFVGAEFTKVYAYKYGSKIQPAETAVPVTPEAQAEQGMPRRETVEKAARGERVGTGSDEKQPGQVAANNQASGGRAESQRGAARGERQAAGRGALRPSEVGTTMATLKTQRRKPSLKTYALGLAGFMLATVAFGVSKPAGGAEAKRKE